MKPERSNERLLDYGNVSHAIFVAHSFSNSYLRTLANKCLPYIEVLAEDRLEELTPKQLKEAISHCELAISKYKNKTHYGAYRWERLLNKFKRELTVEENKSNIKFSPDEMRKKLHHAGSHMNAEHEYAKLLVICEKAIEMYKAPGISYDNECEQYFLWLGFKAFIEDRIANVVRYTKERLIKNKETLEYYKNDVTNYENKIARNQAVIELYTNKELKLDKSDGSCDNCIYNGDEEGCKVRLDVCKNGNYNFAWIN